TAARFTDGSISDRSRRVTRRRRLLKMPLRGAKRRGGAGQQNDFLDQHHVAGLPNHLAGASHPVAAVKGNQNTNLKAPCITRGDCAVRIWPKTLDVNVKFGLSGMKLFVTLNASTRSSMRLISLNLMTLEIAASKDH